MMMLFRILALVSAALAFLGRLMAPTLAWFEFTDSIARTTATDHWQLLFYFALGSLIVGTLAMLGLAFLGRYRQSRFWIGVAIYLAIWGWIGFVPFGVYTSGEIAFAGL
ncbi:MAG TPA: hypothetical protein DCE41_10805 [Cytophagales bacterium]|nr:hypothetical protein [Cytophagales bacterium]HAA21906.1 hypothetical protein [Cytophagales bacterium]HAP64937.1 hypothetical protein [Cytophagales bacterium]